MKRLFAAVLVLSLFVLAACGGANTSKQSGSSSKVIKIGFIGPLSGVAKTYGESAKKGFDLALEQANYKVGDYEIKVEAGDDRADATEGVNLATKMITQQGVKALVGPVTSGSTIAVSAIAEANKVPMITGTATAAKVTVDEKGNRKAFAFRACFIDPFQGEVAAKFASTNLKVKKAAVLYDKGNDYTIGLAESFKKTFEAAGGQVIAWESYSDKDSDFSAIMTNVAAKKPDVLYLPDYYTKVSLIAKAAKDKGLNVPMIGGDGWDSPDLDFATLDGNYFTAHYSSEDSRPEVKKFEEAFQAKYGAKPDSFAALVYDATNMLLDSIKRAGTDDGEKIRAALQDMKDFQAVGGSISFDKNGNPVKPAVILQVQKDKTYKYVTSVK